MYKVLSAINAAILKDSNLVVFYGRTLFDENTLAVLERLVKHNPKDYKLAVITRNKEVINRINRLKGVKIKSGVLASTFMALKAGTIFCSHGMGRLAIMPKRGQRIVNLWHGSTLKKLGTGKINRDFVASFSHFLVASEFMRGLFSEMMGIPQEKFIISALPRTEFLISANDTLDKASFLSKNKKLVIYMPTFRKSSAIGISDGDNAIPFINKENLRYLDSEIDKMGAELIVKLHPLQDDLEIVRTEELKAVKFIDGETLYKKEIKLYSLLGVADALITDYSSVYFDFLWVDKPIAFAISDMEKYEDTRGFAVENPKDFMCGEKLRNETDFINFIRDVCDGKDNFREERKRINALVNGFPPEGATSRLLKLLNMED